MSGRPKQPDSTFRVWSAVTVFVQREGDRAPWTKRVRGEGVTVRTNDYDKALAIGEQQLAAQMYARLCEGEK